MRIALLGTGIMGSPIARNLAAAGHDLTVWNRTREKAEGLGAAVAGTPAEAVHGAEVLVTMLADGFSTRRGRRGATARRSSRGPAAPRPRSPRRPARAASPG